MSYIPAHPKRDGKMYSSFSVILKVRGDALHLWARDELQTLSKKQPFKLFCQHLDDRLEAPVETGTRVFLLSETATAMDKLGFQNQQPKYQSIHPSDLATFMTSPIPSSRKASYALHIGLSRMNSSLEDLSLDDCKKIGTAYLYLDPKFSTQGIQRMQIIGSHNMEPIGQIQVEYLIVTDPRAFDIKVPRPEWLSSATQLDAGHRGAGSGCRGDLPMAITENTIASFNYAARHGADMCELDVMCTADGIPVVYHNYILNTVEPIQIDQVTLKELRGMQEFAIHDKNCKHNRLNDAHTVHLKDHESYPTLEEVLKGVDKSCALNIELKWPQLLPDGKSEAAHFREINDSVDRILNCMYEHGQDRNIFLSTLNADIAILLRLKQSKYPVLFLTTGDSKRFNDPTTKSVKNAIHFALAFGMAGINPNAAYLTEYLVRYAQDRGLLVYAWGKIESAQTIKELRRTGLNGVIYDRIDLIKPQD